MAHTAATTVLHNLSTVDNKGGSLRIYAGRTKKAAGATTAVTIAGARIGDAVICSLEEQDSGTTITSLEGEITAANTLTLTMTDDGSSADDAYIGYLVVGM